MEVVLYYFNFHIGHVFLAVYEFSEGRVHFINPQYSIVWQGRRFSILCCSNETENENAPVCIFY